LAKAFGYGKIRVNVSVNEKERYLKAFELMMNREIEGWNDSEQIRELLTMATAQNNRGNSTLRYMQLDPSRRVDDFRDSKKKNEYLKYYSRLDGMQAVEAKRYSSDEERKDYFERLRQEEERAKLLEEEAQRRRKEEVEAALNPIVQSLEKIIDESEGFKKEKDPNILRNLYKRLKKVFVGIGKDIEAFHEEFGEEAAYEPFLRDAVTELTEKMRSVRDEFSRFEKRIEYAEKNTKPAGSSGKKTVSFDDVLASDKVKIMHDRLKSYLDGDVRLDDSQLQRLKESIMEIYTHTKSKEKKKFFKELQLGRLLGKEFENTVKKSIEEQGL
jgi:hypothetical protein